MSPIVWTLVLGLALTSVMAENDCLTAFGGEGNLLGKKVIEDGPKKARDTLPFPINPIEVYESTIPRGISYRIIHPTDAVTMDYRPYRVNFALDDKDIIERVFCA